MKQFLLFGCLFVTTILQAQRYWVGTSSSSWTANANWSTSAGGTGGAAAPGVNDQVYIDRVTPNPCVLSTAATIQQLTVSAAGLTLTSTGNLTVSNNFNLQGGSITGTSSAVIAANGVMNFSAGTLDLAGAALTIASTFTMTGGTISIGAGSFTANGFVSITNGTFNANSGTVYVNNNAIALGGGALNAGSATFYIRNNMTIASPEGIQIGTSTVIFDGPQQQDVVAVSGNASGKINFYNLVINKPGNNQINFNTASSTDTFQIENMLTLTAGRFTGSGFIKIEKDVITEPTFGGSAIPIACTGPNPSTVTLGAPLGVTGVSNFVGIAKSSPSVPVNVYRSAAAPDDTIRIGNFDARFILRRGILQFPNNPPVITRFRSIEIEPEGTLIAPQNYLINVGEHINSGGVFNANGGTYVFSYPFIPNRTNFANNRETFNNLIIDNQTQFGPGIDDTLVVLGTLIFRSGELHGEARSAFDTKGNVSFETNASPTFGVTNLVFSGTIDQTLTFAPTRIDAWNGSITVNKPSGNLILGSPVVLDQWDGGLGARFFRFTKGIVIGSAANYVAFKNQCIALDANSTSYVDGPVQFQWYADFVFPIGNDGFYAPAKVTSPGTDLVTAQYFHQDPTPLYNTAQFESPLQVVSKREYWMISKTGNSTSPFISLSYDVARSGPITDPSSLRVTRWNGSTWTDLGHLAEPNNFIRTNAGVPSFSPFTLGSTNAITNPLPVHLIGFTARADNNDNLLEWKVDNEIDFDSYLIEASSDGSVYSQIGVIKGFSDGLLHSYSFRHANPGIKTWYRLKMVDRDKKFEYSWAVNVQRAISGLTLQLFPNPVRGLLKVTLAAESASSGTLVVTGSNGIVLRNEQVQLRTGITIYNLQTETLPAGVYFIEIRTEQGNSEMQRFVVTK